MPPLNRRRKDQQTVNGEASMRVAPPDIASSSANDRRVAARDDQPPAADAVSQRAYERFQERGGEHGRDLDDWFAAERELRDGRAIRES